MRPALTFFSAAALTILHVACAFAVESDRAPWLQSKISEYERLAPANPPRAILRGTYQGKTVYYVTPTCCDIPSELYDERGALLCYPSGGFAGGDGRCRTFSLPASAPAVWRDLRRAQPSSGAGSK